MSATKKNDLDYIAASMMRYSLQEDSKILLATIPAVIRQRNDRQSSKLVDIFNMSTSGKSK